MFLVLFTVMVMVLVRVGVERGLAPAACLPIDDSPGSVEGRSIRAPHDTATAPIPIPRP